MSLSCSCLTVSTCQVIGLKDSSVETSSDLRRLSPQIPGWKVCYIIYIVIYCLYCPLTTYTSYHGMNSLFVLKVPSNTNQPKSRYWGGAKWPWWYWSWWCWIWQNVCVCFDCSEKWLPGQDIRRHSSGFCCSRKYTNVLGMTELLHIAVHFHLHLLCSVYSRSVRDRLSLYTLWVRQRVPLLFLW